jgi:hypothetical protein
MSARLKSMRRIVEVQRDLRRAAEWRRAELERRLAALQEGERELVRFLSGENAFSGLFAASLAGRLRSLAAEIEEAKRALAAQAEVVLREAGREKRAERLAATLRREERRGEERNELAAAVEDAGTRHASPP